MDGEERIISVVVSTTIGCVVGAIVMVDLARGIPAEKVTFTVLLVFWLGMILGLMLKHAGTQ